MDMESDTLFSYGRAFGIISMLYNDFIDKYFKQ